MALLLRICAGCVLLFAIPAIAAEEIQQSHIEVWGEGEASVRLDRAELGFSFDALEKELVAATASVESRYAQALEQIRALGIVDKQINGSNINITPVYEYQHQERVYKGMRYKRSAMLLELELEQAGKVIEILVANQVDSLSPPLLYSSNLDQAAQQALANAVKAAMEKARTMAKNAGVRIGNIIRLAEASQRPQPVVREHSRALRAAADIAQPEISPIGASETVITRQVMLKIALLP